MRTASSASASASANAAVSVSNRSVRSTRLRRFVAIIILVAAWEIASIAARSSGPTFAMMVPSWSQILTTDFASFSTFVSGATSDDAHSYYQAAYVLIFNTLVTVRRVALGLLLGGAVGVVSGMLIGFQPVIRNIFYPVVSTLRNVPLLALIALFLVWFGGRESGIVVFISFGLWVIYCTNTIEAIANADAARINFARTLGATKRDIYLEVILPMILPNLFNATKVALGVAWAVALGGEFLAAQDGLGRLLLVSQNYMKTGRMVIILVIYILLTTFFDWLMVRIGKYFTR